MPKGRFKLDLYDVDLQALKKKYPSFEKVELQEDDQELVCANIINSTGAVLLSSLWTKFPCEAYSQIGLIEMPIKATAVIEAPVPTREQRLEIALREALLVAHAWRISWCDFDGRWLRDQMTMIADFVREGKDDDCTVGQDFMKDQYKRCDFDDFDDTERAARIADANKVIGG